MKSFNMVLIFSYFLFFPVFVNAGGLIGDVIENIGNVGNGSELDTYQNAARQAQQSTTNGYTKEYGNVCVTSFGSCVLEKGAPSNTPCYCQTTNGLVYGIAR